MKMEKREYYIGFITICNIQTNLLHVSASLGQLQVGHSTQKYALIISYKRYVIIQSKSLSSSYICHAVGSLVDPFRSHVSRGLFKGLP